MNETEAIQDIIGNAQTILIIQADNPDADSLASALTLETILHDMGKEPLMYCAVDMPEYLKYLTGWDRVSNEVPAKFDASIIVDTSTMSLLEQLQASGTQGRVAAKPCVVLDHHAESSSDIPFASVVLNDTTKVSTGELIYSIAKKSGWTLSTLAGEYIMTSILGDSMGLTTESTAASTYRVMAELVEQGVSRPKLEEQRRAYNKMAETIMRYKGRLLERTEIHNDGSTALLIIPQEEINEYSPLYNPAPLVQPDHLQTEGVRISVVLKHYDSGRITAAIRCNHDAPIAAELAKSFDGGGHAHAAGFKLEDASITTVRSQVIERARELLEGTTGKEQQ
jgi:phosphoesterase RecJ-like protein